MIIYLVIFHTSLGPLTHSLFILDFLLHKMPLPLRYGASVMDCTQKVKQKLKGTKYVNLLSVFIYLCYLEC